METETATRLTWCSRGGGRGRRLESSSAPQHRIDRWREARPRGQPGPRPLSTRHLAVEPGPGLGRGLPVLDGAACLGMTNAGRPVGRLARILHLHLLREVEVRDLIPEYEKGSLLQCRSP